MFDFDFISRYSLIPSAETTTMSSENLDIFGDSSKWTAVASDRALLNAPLHKQSCSDHGVRARNHSGPVNSSTFHRINRNKRNVTEQDLMVVNITTCCPFWNFMKRKPTWWIYDSISNFESFNGLIKYKICKSSVGYIQVNSRVSLSFQLKL